MSFPFLYHCCIIVLFGIDLVNQMASTHSLPLKVVYSNSRGFHIQMYGGGTESYTVDSLPSDFIKVTKFKNTFSFTTTDLVSFLSVLMVIDVLLYIMQDREITVCLTPSF